MPLFHVQDNDRPLWIVAKNYGQAEFIYKKVVARENEVSIDELEPPLGISFICDDSDLLLGGDTREAYNIRL